MQVITKQVDGHKYEPFEEAVIEVPEEHVGPVVDMLGQRKGQMMDLVAGTDTTSLTRYMLIASATISEQLACALFPSSFQFSNIIFTLETLETPGDSKNALDIREMF